MGGSIRKDSTSREELRLPDIGLWLGGPCICSLPPPTLGPYFLWGMAGVNPPHRGREPAEGICGPEAFGVRTLEGEGLVES